MTKKLLIKLIAILLAFVLGFLTCLFTIKSAKQEWTELEATRLEQVDKLNRIIERINEECIEMDTYNEQAVDLPEEGK